MLLQLSVLAVALVATSLPAFSLAVVRRRARTSR